MSSLKCLALSLFLNVLCSVFSLSSLSSLLALLDTLTRNGSSAGNGGHCRQRTTDSSSESTKARAGGQDQEAGGGEPSTKGFTKDQVEGVQR